MAKEDFYRQVKLTRKDPKTGNDYTLVTWVEESKAIVGAKVHIKDDPQCPEDLIWGIAEVGGRQSKAWVNGRQKASERWRSVTDV